MARIEVEQNGRGRAMGGINRLLRRGDLINSHSTDFCHANHTLHTANLRLTTEVDSSAG
jgi:hypothetical protein